MSTGKKCLFLLIKMCRLFSLPASVILCSLITAQRDSVIYPGKQVTELIKITTGQDVLRPGTE